MRCPYCQLPVHPSVAECPACRLSFPKAASLLGVVPRVTPQLWDDCRLLGKAEQQRIKRRIAEVERRFPELAMQVVLCRFPAEHPFSLHVFWLFNAAGLSRDGERGASNHALLLALDPERGEAALMPGYGLEPFLSVEAMDHLLEMAGPAWSQSRWADGIQRVLDGIQTWLETLTVPEDTSSSRTGEY